MTWASQSAISWAVAKRAVNSRKALSIVGVVGACRPGVAGGPVRRRGPAPVSLTAQA
ncbi:hypothetical protein GCM10009696_22950 [Kocuria himachalensis]